MASDDRFKRYQEVGADFFETARTRAEDFLREVTKMGDSTQKQASCAVDDLVGGSRKGTEQLLASIRREITAQLSQLGLATKEDLADLERRLKEAPTKPAATKATPAKRATEKAATKKGPGKKATPTKKTAPAKKATGEV
jgi:polyhydroxyalkanoate synthesis regulator phasin